MCVDISPSQDNASLLPDVVGCAILLVGINVEPVVKTSAIDVLESTDVEMIGLNTGMIKFLR